LSQVVNLTGLAEKLFIVAVFKRWGDELGFGIV